MNMVGVKVKLFVNLGFVVVLDVKIVEGVVG